jgi:hypothetical protein
MYSSAVRFGSKTPAYKLQPGINGSPFGPFPVRGGVVFRRHPRSCRFSLLALFLILACCFSVALSGCGGASSTALSSPSKAKGTLGVSSSSISFGSVSVDKTATATLTLRNDGASQIEVTGLDFSSKSFSVVSQPSLPITLGAGGTSQLTLQFAPTTTSAVSGTLSITSSDSTNPQVSVSLTGSGVSASQTVATLTVSAGSIAFGSVAVNTTATKTLSLSSTGTAAVTVNSVAVSGGGFTVSGATFPLTLNPNQTAQLNVAFDPTATGAASGTLSITSSDSTNPQVSVSLTGSGVSAGQTVATLTVSAGSIAFGDVEINTTATQTLSVSSTGTAAVTIQSVTLGGSGFSVSGATFPLTLDPTKTAVLDVAFDPAAAGAVTGSMTIASNSSANATAIVTLSGTGVANTSGYQVQVAWNAPASSLDPVVGYYIYRSPGGAGTYQQLNSSADSGTTYQDAGVANGQSYDYYVESVDAAGNVSVPSNVTSVSIP